MSEPVEPVATTSTMRAPKDCVVDEWGRTWRITYWQDWNSGKAQITVLPMVVCDHDERPHPLNQDDRPCANAVQPDSGRTES